MEFDEAEKVLPQPITLLSASTQALRDPSLGEHAKAIVDVMGKMSAKAQGLPRPVTSLAVLRQNSDQRLYVLRSPETPSKVLGILKVGYKQLYLLNTRYQYTQTRPLCVLDFYVHESVQRIGYGHRLFTYMLEKEHAKAYQLAYDRPSPKFLAFLGKHHGLMSYTPQANNFVVFDQFFSQVQSASDRRSGSLQVNQRQHRGSAQATAISGEHRRRR